MYLHTKKIWGVEENPSSSLVGKPSSHVVHPSSHQIAPHPDDPGVNKGPSGPGGLFLADAADWRTGGEHHQAWSTGGAGPQPGGPPTASEHAVSQPIQVQRRSSSFPGSDAISSEASIGSIRSMMSPRSSDTGALGVKMVDFVLGSSPTIKEVDARMGRLQLMPNMDHNVDKKKGKLIYSEQDGHKHKEVDGEVGLMQNGVGLDEVTNQKGFNRTPGGQGDEEVNLSEKLKANIDGLVPPSMLTSIQGHFDPSGPFEGLPMDPLQFGDYPSHLHLSSTNSIEPSMVDFNSQQQMYQQQQQRHQLLQQHQQQQQQQQYSQAAAAAAVAAAGHQGQTQNGGQNGHPSSGTPSNPFPQNPYYQDPFAAQMGHLIPAGPPPTMMPQYYGLPPWGMYPGGAPPPPHIQQQQQQQQQLMAAQRSASQRPLTPGGPESSSSGGPQNVPPPQGGGYSMLPPHGYYDQNGGLMMGSGPTRGVNPSAMRLLPPMMMNPGGQGSGPNNLRFGSGSGSSGSGLFSSTSSNGNHSLYSGMGPNSSGVSASGMANGFNPGINHSGSNYGNSGLPPIGAGLGLGSSSPRRDSFDGRRSDGSLGGLGGLDPFARAGLGGKGAGGQFYGGPLSSGVPPSPGPGSIGMSIGPNGGSLSPPPSGSTLGPLGRMMSAAPGAEAKFMMRNDSFSLNSNNSIGFPSRVLQRNPSLDKTTGRSRLLEDFRNNRYPNLQLRDLNEHIVEFSQDQHGSRFIQQKLERATPTEKQLVFSEIIAAAYNLMTDVFGNYVIQKFFEFGSPEQKQSLAMKVKGHVLPLALQMYGCRVIQKALESIPPDQQKEIVKELDGHILKCVKDQNGNHVVQKCIECVDPHALQFIINAFQGQVLSLSTHPYGCRVIQRILEHCTAEQTAPILEELHSHTETLVQDQYGNYVIQHVLEHGRAEDKGKIINSVRGKVLSLSQHKFASNVVEKCVTHASRNERAFLIEEVCTYNDTALYTMMKDQYANYVVQKMIEVAESPQRKLLLQRIRPHLPALRKYTYGKHILAKLEKYMMKNNELGPIGTPSNGSL